MSEIDQTINSETRADFESKLDQMTSRIWEIQYRISELKEFERQWANLFDILEKRIGRACKVNVLNTHALQDFRWDKYHILVSDLHSLFENELESENRESLIRLSAEHLVLLNLDHYLDPNYKVTFIDNPNFKMTEHEREERLEEMRIADAKKTHENKKRELKRLFPKISESFKVTPDDTRHLLRKISSLASEVRGIRHFFNHKYNDLARERYQPDMAKFDLEHIEHVTNALFEIVTAIGLVFKNTSYGKAEIASERAIEDRIDIILFGSIQNAVNRFYKVANKDDYYWQARKKYYESDELLGILSKD